MARKVKLNIEIDGTKIAPITNFSLLQDIHQHHQFKIIAPIEEKDNSLLDESKKLIGKPMEISLDSEWFSLTSEPFFKGIVSNIGLSRSLGGYSELVISGFSSSILTDDGPNCKSYTEKDLKAIVNDIVSLYGNLDIEVKPKNSVKIPYVVQYKESNYEFISRLAQLYGEWFYHDGQKLYFGKPAASEAIPLMLGKNLFNFDLSLRLLPTEFKLQSYDYLNNKVLESPSDSADVADLDKYGSFVFDESKKLFSNKPTLLYQELVDAKSMLDNFAKFRRTDKANDMVIITGSSDSPLLRPGSKVKVTGNVSVAGSAAPPVPVTYGEFTICSIAHYTDGAGNYHNNFEAIPASIQQKPHNSYVRQPHCETQVAVVKENNDPEGLGRIKVQFHWQEGGETTPWIRLAASAAGSGQGYFFVPEIGDEVIVGFEQNNPSKSFVMGCVYHGKSKPEGVGDSENNSKVIKTKSGNQIFFNDKGGGEEIKIVNGANVIHLNLGGSGKISITSAGDIELSAANISITAEKNVTINAGTDLTADAGGNMGLNGGKELATSAGTKTTMSTTELSVSAKTKAGITAGAEINLTGGAKVGLTAPIVKLN